MERKKIAAANWKMNLQWVEAFDLATAVAKESADNKVQKILCVPAPYLQMCSVIIESRKDFAIGAQDISAHPKGAFTGEVSAAMVRSAGATYVIVGHSERRAYHGEAGRVLRDKMARAYENGLSPIFCIGEKLDERKSGKHFEIVRAQLQEVLESVSAEQLSTLVLAYEPVWAIGTGETATPAQAQEMHAMIREWMSSRFGESGRNVSILYGGSCNARNAAELFACPDVDGGLVGGASLVASDYCTIASAFK